MNDKVLNGPVRNINDSYLRVDYLFFSMIRINVTVCKQSVMRKCIDCDVSIVLTKIIKSCFYVFILSQNLRLQYYFVFIKNKCSSYNISLGIRLYSLQILQCIRPRGTSSIIICYLLVMWIIQGLQCVFVMSEYNTAYCYTTSDELKIEIQMFSSFVRTFVRSELWIIPLKLLKTSKHLEEITFSVT